jgi:hypothetical protein
MIWSVGRPSKAVRVPPTALEGRRTAVGLLEFTPDVAPI